MTDDKPDGRDTDRTDRMERDENRDPLSGAKGAHPIGTAAGATGAAAAGAAVGAMVGGPIGLAVGGVAGAVAGGLAGKGIAEAINPTKEDEYWRSNFSSRPYATKQTKYEMLEPAYRYGWEQRGKHMSEQWRDVEQDLSKGWEKARGKSKLAWNDAKHAARDAWEHIGSENDRMDDDGGKMPRGNTQADGMMDKKRV